MSYYYYYYIDLASNTGSLDDFRTSLLCINLLPLLLGVAVTHLLHVIVMPTVFQSTGQENNVAQTTEISYFASHLIFHRFSLFICCLSVVCSLTKGITPNIGKFCFSPNK